MGGGSSVQSMRKDASAVEKAMEGDCKDVADQFAKGVRSFDLALGDEFKDLGKIEKQMEKAMYDGVLTGLGALALSLDELDLAKVSTFNLDLTLFGFTQNASIAAQDLLQEEVVAAAAAAAQKKISAATSKASSKVSKAAGDNLKSLEKLFATDHPEYASLGSQIEEGLQKVVVYVKELVSSATGQKLIDNALKSLLSWASLSKTLTIKDSFKVTVEGNELLAVSMSLSVDTKTWLGLVESKVHKDVTDAVTELADSIDKKSTTAADDEDKAAAADSSDKKSATAADDCLVVLIAEEQIDD